MILYMNSSVRNNMQVNYNLSVNCLSGFTNFDMFFLKADNIKYLNSINIKVENPSTTTDETNVLNKAFRSFGGRFFLLASSSSFLHFLKKKKKHVQTVGNVLIAFTIQKFFITFEFPSWYEHIT